MLEKPPHPSPERPRRRPCQRPSPPEPLARRGGLSLRLLAPSLLSLPFFTLVTRSSFVFVLLVADLGEFCRPGHSSRRQTVEETSSPTTIARWWSEYLRLIATRRFGDPLEPIHSLSPRSPRPLAFAGPLNIQTRPLPPPTVSEPTTRCVEACICPSSAVTTATAAALLWHPTRGTRLPSLGFSGQVWSGHELTSGIRSPAASPCRLESGRESAEKLLPTTRDS